MSSFLTAVSSRPVRVSVPRFPGWLTAAKVQTPQWDPRRTCCLPCSPHIRAGPVSTVLTYRNTLLTWGLKLSGS